MSPKTSKLNGISSKQGLLKHSGRLSRARLSIVVVIFAVIGGYILYHTFAAGPLVASLEAEQMNLPTGASVITDSLASGGKAVKFTANGVTSGSVNFPSSVTSLTVQARGDQCNGAPTMTVALDGTNILTNVSVSATAWTSYNFTPSNAYNSGSHNLSISFTNALAKTKGKVKTQCSRNLYADVTNFYGPTPPPPPAPTVTLSASPNSVTAGQTSTLTWASTNASSCNASGAWSGSEPVSGSANTGALNQNSTYSLTCTGNGGSSTASTSVTVSASQTVSASFTAAPTSGSTPLAVSFKDTSTGAPNSWSWNFGDGTSSTVQNPSHIYSSAGTYTVTLTASNSTNSNTVTMADLITASKPAGVVDQMVTPEGATIQIYSGITGSWTAQSIYNLLKPNAYQLSVVGPHLTIKVQPQYASSTTTGVSNSGGCSYYNYNAIMYLDAAAGTNFDTVPEAVITHEYGHAWTIYYLEIKHCDSWNDYLSERGILGDSRVNTNYMWNSAEMAAEDYRQLFGDAAAVSGYSQVNYQIPPASSIPGFKDWFINSWGSP